MPMFSFQFVPVMPEGHRLARGDTPLSVWANSIDDRYFDTMEIGFIAGRPFAPSDDADAPAVAIVNETLARHWWPDTDPIGMRLQVLEPPQQLVEIVGIVKTTKYGFPGEQPQQAIYFPYQQRPRGQMVLLAATSDESAALLTPLQNLVHRLDADVPVYEVQTIEAFYDVRVTAIGNTLVRLIGGMGVMGLLLTMVGLYGLVSYRVSSRVHEIGIRIAIGATYGRIMSMVLREGLAVAWLGVAAGAVLSVVTARVLFALLPLSYHIGMHTYYVVIPLVLAVNAVAAFLPARRAAKVDPTEALRCE
jgi:putative ABC transport system permease protein